MAAQDVAGVAADDDFAVAAELTAAFDAAKAAETPELPLETAEQAAERVRDEKGRFAKADDNPEPDPVAAAAKPAAQSAAQVAPPAPDAPAAAAEPVKPPPGFSPTAKVVWDKETLSKEEWEAVKRDISKRNDEVGKGFAQLAEYKPIERFAEMARQSGTTLDRALENYVGIENRLRQDFPTGIAELCQRQGVHPVALARAI